jgi:hypothetical protein
LGKLGPPLAILLGLVWIGQPVPADWPLGPVGWQGPALVLLLLGVLGVLHLTSRYLQARVVALAWLLTRDDGRANRVYFALMRPGVLVHELAHAIAAALVGGRIVSFNMLETTVTGGRGGPVRLGHVVYAIPGGRGRLGTRLKDAFVGFAPLPFGLLLVGGALALSGLDWLGDPLAALPIAAGTWRFWVALLVILEVADQMTPSSVDRKNWPAALLVALVLAVLTWAAVTLLQVALPPAWWQVVLQAGLVLIVTLLVPIGVNVALGVLFWLLWRVFYR